METGCEVTILEVLGDGETLDPGVSFLGNKDMVTFMPKIAYHLLGFV